MLLIRHALFYSLLLLSGCWLVFPKHCQDIDYWDVTQEEINFLPGYDKGDTISFSNLKDGKKYNAICTSREIRRESTWLDGDDLGCKQTGFYKTYDRVEILFDSDDLPNRRICYSYFARPGFNFYIGFRHEEFSLSYDFVANRLTDPIIGYPHEIAFFDKLEIYDNEYQDVFKISGSWESYDTIFYNSEYGLLRLVDIEENLDIVLLR